MKIMTFFSEKGGVGKSSFSMMYASWLKYEHGVNVALADFNDRISDYRRSEIINRNRLIANGADVQPFDVESAWPIVRAKMSEIEEYKNIGSRVPNASWLDNEITEGRLKGYDVVICDFPGSLTGGEFTQVAGTRMLGLTVIPTERDEMTLNSTYKLNLALEHMKKQGNPMLWCMFINRVQLGLNSTRNKYLGFGPKLMGKGFPMLPDMVSYSERMLTIDKVDILRSTFAYPDFEKPEFSGSKDLGITNLFIDITRLLKGSPDYRNTASADLSFIDSLKKTDDGRQFKGSAFPAFEI